MLKINARSYLLILLCVVAQNATAFSQEPNFADPNLLPEGFPKTHCKLGSNECDPVPDSSKEEYDRQFRAREDKNKADREKYLAYQKHKRDECMKGCDAWFHPSALPKPNASCKADCK